MLSNWEEEKKRVLQEELGVAEDIAAMDSVNGGDGLGGSVLGRSILGQSTRRVSCASRRPGVLGDLSSWTAEHSALCSVV
jgi:nuclear pore complex protein Nup93